MTKADIRAVLKGLVKDEWLIFEDNSNKDLFLKRIKDKDDSLRDIIDDMFVCEIVGGIEYLEDMDQELSNLED